uniref:Uncharacterized protein n=1 Tax=Rhizophora mucronata TaxID=61149 RepID=A0A2P2LA84_RHIMU
MLKEKWKRGTGYALTQFIIITKK